MDVMNQADKTFFKKVLSLKNTRIVWRVEMNAIIQTLALE